MTRQRIALLVLLASGIIAAASAARIPRLFVTADRCMACHNGLVTPKGEDVSIGTDWRASMMANAARDPYWQASVRREVLARPRLAAAIENECAACHMPMARHQAKAEGRPLPVFAHLPAVPEAGPEPALALDGVSCTMCHQIGEQGLGARESFGAGFTIDLRGVEGYRRVFGPYDIDRGRRTAMSSSSGFSPERGDHVGGSELCATCHTLYTHAYDAEGREAGTFPEQVPYLEWKHSAYAGRRECQGCHMPAVEGTMPISSTLGQPREDPSRHVFRGGNFLVPTILNLRRSELGTAAEPLELAAVSSRTADNLKTSSAGLEVRASSVRDGMLRAEVAVENLAGHKLPTAYPSRRAWVHLTVRDGSGAVAFESGRLRADGAIEGNDNDEDPSRYEPHHAEVRSRDEVQIYEPVLGDTEGRVTTELLSAARYLKDNRLLPAGFDKASAPEDIAVRGQAAADGDFAPGGDRVRYAVPVGSSAGPYTVRAELLYQPISFRWARNIKDRPSDEAGLFVSAYDALAPSSAVVLAAAEARTD